MSTLASVARQIADATSPFPDYSLDIDDVYRMLDARGPLNSHLAIAGAHRDEQRSWARRTPLLGTEAVSGRYLIIHYVAHIPELTLREYATLGQLEEQLLDDAGICNHFTTFMIPFVDFRYLAFTITFQDPSGSQQTFDKRRQYDRSEGFGFTYLNRKIKWQVAPIA